MNTRATCSFVILIVSLWLPISLFAQDQTYDFDYHSRKQGIITTLVFYAGVQAHNLSIGRGVIEDVDRVNPMKLWRIDQQSVNQFSKSANQWSDIAMVGSLTLPMLVNLNTKISKTQKWNIVLMGAQGLIIENGLNTLIKNIVQRPRPFLYNNKWIVNNRPINKNSSRSFYSGHTSGSAYLCFFGAKVFAGTHPNTKWKPVVWGVAATLPAITGYLRYKAGKHFPTDIIVGYIAGASIGYLLPTLYKSDRTDLTIGMSDIRLHVRL